MTPARYTQFALAGLLVAAMHAAPAQAATRTWVSGTGDDGFPCSRTAPCKTWAGAISKTDPGGEISVLDPGGYGDVTITKSITINGEGTLASGLSTATAITVAAGATDVVILRNLSLDGVPGHAGISISTAGNVTIDKCFVYGFTSGAFVGGVGISVGASGSMNVQIRDTNITNSSHGVLASTSGGFVLVALDNVRINGTPGYAVGALSSGANISVRNSLIQNAGYGVHTGASGATIKLEHSQVANSSFAVDAGASGSTIGVNDVSLYYNTNALTMTAGATIATANNNKAMDNGGSLATNATISQF